MEHIGRHLKRAVSKSRATERGELMKYFLDKLNAYRVADGYPKLSMGRMGKILQQIPTKDLYYIKSVCDDSMNFSKKFWWLMNPKKHEQTPDDTRPKDKKPK